MDAKEIEAGNRMIAEFMRLKPLQWKNSSDGSDMLIWVDAISGITVHDEPELYYHSSWDWLMPIVERADEYGVWTIRPGYVSFKSFNGELRKERIFHFNTSQMDWEAEDGEPVAFIFLLYSVVVKFLTWQSTLKTPQQ